MVVLAVQFGYKYMSPRLHQKKLQMNSDVYYFRIPRAGMKNILKSFDDDVIKNNDKCEYSVHLEVPKIKSWFIKETR